MKNKKGEKKMETKKLSFFLPMIPPTITHQEKKIKVVRGKPIVYEDASLQDARMKLTAYVGQHVPERKLQGPIRLIVKWIFPLTKAQKKQEVKWCWKITKPDTDNLNKLLKDVMTALKFWQDDAEVASEIIEKFTSDTPGLFISVEEIE